MKSNDLRPNHRYELIHHAGGIVAEYFCPRHHQEIGQVPELKEIHDDHLSIADVIPSFCIPSRAYHAPYRIQISSFANEEQEGTA